MASYPDLSIFRRFGALNTQNLLFLQAEITHLERALNNIRRDDEETNNESGLTAQRNWYELSELSDDGEPNRQWVIIQNIREKLQEYSKNSHHLCETAIDQGKMHRFYNTKHFVRSRTRQDMTCTRFASG